MAAPAGRSAMAVAAEPGLPRRPLGSTGLEVSVLGYGASGLGGVFEAVDEEDGIRSVHHAFRSGINFFDTSPFYGFTKSETVLGRALRDLPRSEIVVATKVGRYGVSDFDFSAARVTASVSESLQRLQLPYLDIIQCHDIEFGDLDQIVSETIPALQQLKAQGLVRHIGITGLPLGALTYVLDRVPPGTVESVMSYCHYCLNDTSLERSIPYFQSKGVAVVNASPLSMGLLTPQGPPVWHPAPPELKRRAKEAAELAAARGTDLPTLGLGFALRNKDICSTFVGMYTTRLVDASLKTAYDTFGLGAAADAPADEAAERQRQQAEVLAEVQAVLAPVKDVTWPSGRWQGGP